MEKEFSRYVDIMSKYHYFDAAYPTIVFRNGLTDAGKYDWEVYDTLLEQLCDIVDWDTVDSVSLMTEAHVLLWFYLSVV